MKVLGIHDGHGASACLVEDGRIVTVVQEERLSRVKNQGGFPHLAIKEVLKEAGCELEEVDHFVFAGKNTTHNDVAGADFEEVYLETGTIDQFGKRFERIGGAVFLKKKGIEVDKISFVDHHSCHAATAYFGQADRGSDMLVLTCDASGDKICATVNLVRGGSIERIAEIGQDESVGIIYSLVTFLMGFKPFQDEYKIMGMAPYGQDSEAAKEICNELISMFEFEELLWRRKDLTAPTSKYGPMIEELIARKRFDDVAGGVQLFIEKFFVEWVRRAIEKTGIKKVGLSGGLFMNVKVNKLIAELEEVEDIFVFPSCGDETNSIGAAWLKFSQVSDMPIESLKEFYLAGDFKDEQSKKAIDGFNFSKQVNVERFDDIEKKVAELLSQGKIVARCKGKSEFGARALGNRSILADASNTLAVNEINEMIKMRDFWMPFAPSVLDSDAERYIENPKGIVSPYMILAFDSKSDEQDNMAAAIHPSDKTCRPQVVTEEYNADYYKLLKYFKEMTGRGIILNTSFNLHGWPMVYKPVEALEVFDRSGLKFLAIGNYLISSSCNN